MKSAKPYSSPGRPNKFPAPLMRLLRSNNAGGMSRGRSRSSRRRPLFLWRKKNSNTTQQDQEPSSPKVTCIGQVRVRRSASKRPKKHRFKRSVNGFSGDDDRGCCCSSCFPRKSRPLCSRPWAQLSLRRPGWWTCPRQPTSWPNCVSIFYCGSSWVRPRKNVSQRVGSRVEEKEMGKEEGENRNEEAENKVKGFTASGENRARTVVSIFESEEEEDDTTTTPPPKNALLLTRCRSAPYRSTSLAVRFWGSPPMLSEEKKGENEAAKKSREQYNDRESGTVEAAASSPALGSEPICCSDLSAEESRADDDSGVGSSRFPEGEEAECDGGSGKSLGVSEEGNKEAQEKATTTVKAQPISLGEGKESEVVGRPMLLICKSVPPRSGLKGMELVKVSDIVRGNSKV